MRKQLVIGLMTTLTALSLSPASAFAADPPASWENRRVLTCEGAPVVAYLTPGGFGTSFHVLDSTTILIPMHVEVIFLGETEPVVTLDKPGVGTSAADLLACGYTDPAGLQVSFIAVATTSEHS